MTKVNVSNWIFLFKKMTNCLARNWFYCGTLKINENCDLVKTLKKEASFKNITEDLSNAKNRQDLILTLISMCCVQPTCCVWRKKSLFLLPAEALQSVAQAASLTGMGTQRWFLLISLSDILQRGFFFVIGQQSATTAKEIIIWLANIKPMKLFHWQQIIAIISEASCCWQ